MKTATIPWLWLGCYSCLVKLSYGNLDGLRGASNVDPSVEPDHQTVQLEAPNEDVDPAFYCKPLLGFADPAFVEYTGCKEEAGQQEVTRLKWAVRYLRAASTSEAFRTCLDTAVHQKTYLQTSQEHESVGPYAPCDGAMQDPAFVLASTNPQSLAYQVVVDTARAAGYSRKLRLECGDEFPHVMQSPGEYRWDYDRESDWASVQTHVVQINRAKVFGRFPKHAPGEEHWPDIFGRVGYDSDEDGLDELEPFEGWTVSRGYNISDNEMDADEDGAEWNQGKSYPVDEISGILLHEMLHNLRFHHGISDDDDGGGSSCGYTRYDCAELEDPGVETCRANSLLEIAEACLSEVVEKSVERCHPEQCCSINQIPIWWEGPEGPEEAAGSCECESFW